MQNMRISCCARSVYSFYFFVPENSFDFNASPLLITTNQPMYILSFRIKHGTSTWLCTYKSSLELVAYNKLLSFYLFWIINCPVGFLLSMSHILCHDKNVSINTESLALPTVH